MRFDKDRYDTPSNYPKLLGDRLCLGTRFYFYYRFFKLVYDTRVVIKKGKFSNKAWCWASYYNDDTVEGCGAKFHVSGMDNIRNCHGPVVFVGNHMSILETFALPGIICPIKPSSFVVKQSLVDHRFFGVVMRATQAIPVTRTDPVKDYKTVMTEGKKHLDAGRSIIIFPQSTRGPLLKSEEFGSIGSKLAKKANVPVIPIAIKSDFWGNGKYFKDFGPVYRDRDVYFSFGEPIKIKGNGKAEHEGIISFIKGRLDKWGHQY